MHQAVDGMFTNLNFKQNLIKWLFCAGLTMACASVWAQTSGAATTTQAQALTGCPSETILAKFKDFGQTGKMPPDLGRWLGDPKAQYIEPYKAFDNVYYVGVCWVSAWIVKTSAGVVLIDTLHEPFVDQLIENIKKVGVDMADIKYVLMTHGHFDHVGGAYKIQALTNAKFVMTQAGWDEAFEDSAASEKTPRPWKMMSKPDTVVKDGDVITLGDNQFGVFETPGHTYGTVSYSFYVQDGKDKHRAFTIGGLGLNAIQDSRQVEAYIASVNRIEQLAKQAKDPITVHLTTHPFSTGLTEAKELLKTRQPNAKHPLVDSNGFTSQLTELRADAVARLAVEQRKEKK